MKEGGEDGMPVAESTTMPPGASINNLVPEGWHVVSEAAVLAGKSVDTIRRWRREGIFIPSGYMKAGSLKVSLYSDDDIEEMKKIAATLRPGRKPQQA